MIEHNFPHISQRKGLSLLSGMVITIMEGLMKISQNETIEIF